MSRALLVLLCVTTPMGCIITRDPSYPEPANTPAVVLDTVEHPFNHFRNVYLDMLMGGDGGGIQTEISFTARVLDPDVDQPLQGLVYVDFNPDAVPSSNTFAIRPTGTVTRPVDAASFRVQVTALQSPGCHAVELHVSERFVDVPPRPEVPEDLGTGVWWVNVAETMGDEVTVDRCP